MRRKRAFEECEKKGLPVKEFIKKEFITRS